MRPKTFAMVGIILIVLAIVVHIYAGQVDRNTYRMEDNYRKKQQEITDANMYASWLYGLSQILVFAGIGFILFRISTHHQPEKELSIEEHLDEVERKIEEIPSMIKAVCPNCKYTIEVEESDIGSGVICPHCHELFRIKPMPPPPKK